MHQYMHMVGHDRVCEKVVSLPVEEMKSVADHFSALAMPKHTSTETEIEIGFSLAQELPPLSIS